MLKRELIRWRVLEHSKCIYISYWMNLLEDSRYELNRAFLTVCWLVFKGLSFVEQSDDDQLRRVQSQSVNYYCVSANTLLWAQSTHGQRTISKLFGGYGTSFSYNEAVQIICLWSVVYVTGWEVCMVIRCSNVSVDRSSSTTSSLQHLSDGFSNLTIDILTYGMNSTHNYAIAWKHLLL